MQLLCCTCMYNKDGQNIHFLCIDHVVLFRFVFLVIFLFKLSSLNSALILSFPCSWPKVAWQFGQYFQLSGLNNSFCAFFRSFIIQFYRNFYFFLFLRINDIYLKTQLVSMYILCITSYIKTLYTTVYIIILKKTFVHYKKYEAIQLYRLIFFFTAC